LSRADPVSFLEFVKDISFEGFAGDRKTCSAVIREFEIVGEAVGKLPDEIKDRYPNVVWQDIKDFRNLLIHEYFICPPLSSEAGGERRSSVRTPSQLFSRVL
jgi:uncharacterized protein with HEPN domain